MRFRKVKDRPSVEKLKELLANGESYSSIGRMYEVSDNAVRKWFKLAGEQPVKICGESEYIKDALTGEMVWKEHNAIVSARKHFANVKNAQIYSIQNGKLKNLGLIEYEILKETMSIRAIGRMYGVRHSTLVRKFNRKIHQEILT